MISYKLMNDGSVMRDADLALIPPTEDNADWRQYLADVKAGAIVEPFDYAAEEARQSAAARQTKMQRTVTMRQARLALLQSGLLSQVNAAVAAADEATKITWEFSSEVQRGHPFVATLAAALNLSEAQIDDLFTLAATL